MNPRSEALVLAAIDALPQEALLAFLSRQRWFAAKGATPSAARIVDAIVVPWGDGAYVLARASVETVAGAQLYQLPLAAHPNPSVVPGHAVVGVVTAHGAPSSVYDAMHDPTFRAGLWNALVKGVTVRQESGHVWTAQPADAARAPAGTDVASALGSAEQSNTSIVFGDAAIYKLFRLLKPGVHPDVEVTAFLTNRAHFRHTPALLSTSWFGDRGEQTVSGMLQEFFPGSLDAWSYTLEQASGYYAAPLDRESANPSIADARTLGEITRDLHQALACDEQDPAFAPEPVTQADVERWAGRTQQSVRESLAMLERQSRSPDFPRARAAEGKALVGRAEHFVGWIDEIVDNVGDDLGQQIRIHGDYHLGQILHTASGAFKVIDFEGEPSRSLAERREKASPLRDVAGMLRSFSYAAAALAMSVQGKIDPRSREIRSARWERDVRAAFLQGYLRDARSSDEVEILPADEQHIRQLVALFETEKAFYELTYELNNRPAWVWIPMRGIAKLFTR